MPSALAVQVFMCVQFTLIKQHVACCEVGGGWGLTLRLANDPLQLEKASHCSANLMLHLHQAVCVYPVFHCAGELESVLYTVLYWFSNGHLAWETDGGRIEVAVALKESVMALHFEVRCRPQTLCAQACRFCRS